MPALYYLEAVRVRILIVYLNCVVTIYSRPAFNTGNYCRFIANLHLVLHCADTLEQTLDGTGRYYESIDLIDAFHPQTILAYSMNGKDLEVAHGAPLRLRVERHLGYKHAKYVMRIEIRDKFDDLWGGKGGFWEDRGYEWYAGI